MKKLRTLKVKRGRRPKAFALVTIIVIGFFAIAMMMALFPLILNTIRSESTNRSMSELRNAAEIGVDYAAKQLNDALISGTASTIEPVAGVPEKVTSLPATLFPDLPGVAVNIKVRRMTGPEYADFKTYCSLYSPQLDPANNSSAGKSYLDPLKTTTVSSDHWRIIESTASRGVFSRSIRVILEPQFGVPPGPGGGAPGGPSSFFKNSFVGNSSITTQPLTGTLSINGQNPNKPDAYELNLKTNAFATVGVNTDLYGNLWVSNIMNGAPSVIANGPGPRGTPLDPSIHGRVITNGNSSGFQSSVGDNPAPNDSVRADIEQISAGQTPPPRTGLNNTDATQSGNNAAGNSVTVSPVISDSTAAPLPDVASLASQNAPLPGSSYTTSTFTADATNLTQPLSTSGTVKIFVQDGAYSGSAVSINSSLFNSPADAGNLQIFYPGNRAIDIVLDGQAFNGVIYAPNAPVNIKGTGNFTGAIVGDKVSLTNTGVVTIRNDLQDVNNAAPYKLTYSSLSNPLNPDEPQLQGYKSVSWQETTRRLVQ
jgi:hypothetical protein